jgi:hypothetical protein
MDLPLDGLWIGFAATIDFPKAHLKLAIEPREKGAPVVRPDPHRKMKTRP